MATTAAAFTEPRLRRSQREWADKALAWGRLKTCPTATPYNGPRRAGPPHRAARMTCQTAHAKKALTRASLACDLPASHRGGRAGELCRRPDAISNVQGERREL